MNVTRKKTLPVMPPSPHHQPARRGGLPAGAHDLTSPGRPEREQRHSATLAAALAASLAAALTGVYCRYPPLWGSPSRRHGPLTPSVRAGIVSDSADSDSTAESHGVGLITSTISSRPVPAVA